MHAGAAPSQEDFTQASAVTLQQPGLFTARIPDGWQQGRGAFGGLVLATLTRAMDAAVGEPDRPLRVLSGEILGPVLPGEVRIDVAALREGTGMSFLEAKLTQDNHVLARATGTYGRVRVTDRDVRRPLSPMPSDWSAVPVAPVGPPAGPVFTQHFEFRVTGPAPFSCSPSAESEGWIRPRTALPRWGAPEIVGLADAWWPATLATETAPRPMATVSFTLQFLCDPATVSPAAPLFFRAGVLAAHDGYVVEHRGLWTAAGEPVALNDQTFVIIK